MSQAYRTLLVALCLLGFVNCSSNRPAVVSFPPVIAVAATSGTPQSHAVNGSFGVPLVATVTSNGSPASGLVVTFRAPATGASGTFANTTNNISTATTDSNGLATSAVFAANGTAGSYIVAASVPGAPALANFSLTNTVGTPATITATGGNSQSTAINTAFATPLSVTVVDSGQNPVSSAIVVFVAPTSGASGTFADTGTSMTTATTNASGVATSTVFTANGTAGADTVTASIGGVSASFILMNLSGTPATITATGGTPQNAAVNTAFAAPLVATVLDSGSNPVSGVSVTFTAPTGTGVASGTFTNGTNTETDTTNSSGVATSTIFSANGVLGANYTVTATAAGVSAPADFSLTNRAATTSYVFYLSGQEAFGPNFYALAGSVQIDSSGNVFAGEQDYNDAQGFTSPEPSGDAITGGSLTVDPSSGQGTLTLITNNPSLPSGGTEVFGIQFVNTNHALIIQFDGSATSSGSMDLQTLSGSLNGGYAFTLSGVDLNDEPVSFGGVFSITGGATLQNGSLDTNDAGTVSIATALSGTLSAPDSFGRGTITGFSNPVVATPLALNYYIVGPEVIRIIDVDTTNTTGVNSNDTAVGSAFGQGTNATSATNASLGTSIFGIAGSPFPTNYAAAGMFSTTSGSGTFSGVADDDELSFGVLLSATPISGTYSIAGNGYGNMTITSGDLGDISTLGVYMTDPNLNLLDPNNTSSGLGGAIAADMDAVLAGGAGIFIPQTDTAITSFVGNYGFGAQVFNICCEFDFVGQRAVKSGTVKRIGLVSDPFFTLGANATNTGVIFSGTPQPDTSNIGRYTLFSTNTVPNPFNITIGGVPTSFDVAIYQASGLQLLWLNEDFGSVFLGSLQQQGSLTGLPAARTGSAKTNTRR